MQRDEQNIQRAIFQHLKARCVPGVFAFHVPMGGFRRPKEAAIFKGIGCVPGIPDVIAIKDGRTYALEIKTQEGRLTPRQRETIEAMRAAGAFVCVVYGLNAAIKQIEQWGLVRGVAA